MEVGELAKLQHKQKQMKKKRQQLIHEEFKKKHREKVNLDQSSVKKGYIEKHKIIAKKTFQTLVQKKKKAPVQLQQNVNVNTFISMTSNYSKILARTKERIQFDGELLKQGTSAINAFGIANKEHIINFTLQFDHPIECQPRPFLIDIPHPQKHRQIVIILPQVKQKQDCFPFQKITHLNLAIMSSSQFIHKINNDKIFSKKIFQQQIKCLIKFQLFKSKKMFQNLLKKGIPTFPIDIKKVPFSLSSSITNYPEYIEWMANKYVCIIKSGRQQIFRLKTGQVSEIIENSKVITYQLTSKLIQKSKVKQNKLVSVSLKTASSIKFEVYHEKQ